MSGRNTKSTSNRQTKQIQRRAHTPAERFYLTQLGSLVVVLNVWNDLDLEKLEKTADGHALLTFANAEAAKTARDKMFPEGCGQEAPMLRFKELSFIVRTNQLGRLVYLLPQKKLQEKGIDFATLEKAFKFPGEHFEQPLCQFLTGGYRKEEWEKILYDEFKERFKERCLDELSPVNRFNVDFLPACFEGEDAIPKLVNLEFVEHAHTVGPDSTSKVHAYPGQMALEFASPEDCEQFIELLEKQEKERAKEKGSLEVLWVKPEASGRVMTLDLRRFYNLYPDETKTKETKFSSRRDFNSYLDKIRPEIRRARFVSHLNNLLAVSEKTYRFSHVRFDAPASSKPDQYRIRFYVSNEADAKRFLTDIYGLNEEKPEIFKEHKGSYYVGVSPTRIYRLLRNNSEARELYDSFVMPRQKRLPLKVFKGALEQCKKQEKSQPYFEALIEQAVSAVNTTGKKSRIQRFFNRKESWLSVDKVSVNADANIIKFSLSAFDESSLEKFRQICRYAGCSYAKNDEETEGFVKTKETFIFSMTDMERLIKYLDEHPELIGEKRPLDFSTLRLHEELTYFETVLRFQSAIDDAASNHKDGVSDDAHAKAQALYERIRAGYAHREYLYQEFRPEEGNHRLFSQPCEHDVWQLQQVRPDAKHPTVITVACATRPGAKLSNHIILDTLKKAIVAELFKSRLEGQEGQIDVRLDITDRRGKKVSEAMQKRIIELAKKEDFTLKELGITEKMMTDHCGAGKKLSLGRLYLDRNLVNDKLEARKQDTDTQYALPEGVDTEGVHLGVEPLSTTGPGNRR